MRRKTCNVSFEIPEDVITTLIKRCGDLGMKVTNRDIETYLKDYFILYGIAIGQGFKITVTDEEI